MNQYLGLDIGGSHVCMGIVRRNESQSQVRETHSICIDSSKPADAILDFISNAIVDFLDEQAETTIEGVGISIPGPFQYSKGVLQIRDQNKYDHLFGLNIRASLVNRLKSDLSVRESNIFFTNDAEAFVRGTVQSQNLDPEKKILGITLGTGLGAGYFAEGQFSSKISGKTDSKYLFEAPFKNGVAEDYLSARWLVQRYNQLKNGTQPAVQNVKDLAGLDNQLATRVFDEFGRNLGDFLSSVLEDLEADRLLLGGNISKVYSRFKTEFIRSLEAKRENCPISCIENTSESAIKGAVDKAAANFRAENRKVARKSINPELPLTKEHTADTYDIYPGYEIGSHKIKTGLEGIADFIASRDKVIIDGYVGVDWDRLLSQLNEELVQKEVTANWYCIDAAWKPEEEINEMLAPFLKGKDPVFGHIYPGELKDFFDKEKLEYFQLDSEVPCIVYGSGAHFADPDAPLVYIDIPKNEIQYRSRAGRVCNIGSTEPLHPKEQYKRFYFIDWIVLNKHKKKLLPQVDVIIDEQRVEGVTWMSGADFRDALHEVTQNVFRVRPWFESGVWGGQWMKEHIKDLNNEAVNYAWSFECIVPENGIILQSDSRLLEVSFDFLMYFDNEAILGKASERFGDEFPIRFDFLDTFEGDNLSLQCHPTDTYIRENFGENFTQDETYYILDSTEGAEVYLGFQDNINANQFREELESSQANGTPVPVEDYIQKFPASKHDLFLIPAGTVHCSGKNNLVLEISSTPYIYTFKMYDWLRLDLDGNPRPINIKRAFENLNFARKGDRVAEELISSPTVIEKGKDWRLVHLPTHSEHFYDVHRVEFEGEIEMEMRGKFHLLNLVEGSKIVVKTGDREQEIHYAETFIIPAAAQNYKLTNKGNSPAKVVKAFVKDDVKL